MMTEIPHLDDYHGDECPVCGSDSECLEYDSDEDYYFMKCIDKDHKWTMTDSTEVWK